MSRESTASAAARKTFAFGGNSGVEGMLDVILGCTLTFMILTPLIQSDQANERELSYQNVNLSKANSKSAGGASVERTVITLKMNGAVPEVYLDGARISQENLSGELKKMEGLGQIAIQRDMDLPCKWEDRVILQCREAGIDRVALVMDAGR